MSTVFTENENNDIYMSDNNQIAISTELDAVLQACQAAMEIQKNEALYSQDNGIPNNSVAWDRTPNLSQFEFFARKQILNIANVTGVEKFTITTGDNMLQYQVSINTAYGTGDIDGSV